MNKIEMSKVINYFTYKYNGDWDYIYDAIQNKEKIDINDLEEFIHNNEKIKYISIIDEEYPENYKSIYMPPLTIYYEGNNSLLNEKNIISLFGDIDDETFKKILNRENVYALRSTEKNINFVKKWSNNGYKFIIVEYDKFNNSIKNIFNNLNNILYIGEIPNIKNDIKARQKMERLLLGVSNNSIFLNKNDLEFEEYKNINMFEKRKMNVAGNINNSYLSFAKKYQQN